MATAAGKRIMVEGGHRRVRRGEGGALEGVHRCRCGNIRLPKTKITG